jgi:hypothetical protein
MMNKLNFWHRTIILVVLLSLGVAAGFLWRMAGMLPSTPLTALPTVEIAPAVPQSTSSSYTVRVSAPTEKSLPVYRYKFSREDARERAVGWVRNLGFSGDPRSADDAQQGTLLIWEKAGERLVVDPKASQLAYKVDLLSRPQALSGSFLPSPKQAATIVERTLLDLGQSLGVLEFAPEKTRFLKVGAARVSPTSAAGADLLEVFFAAKIDEYPLYLRSAPQSADPVVAWIGKDGNLLRLDLTMVGSLGEKIGDYPLKTAEQIRDDLNDGKGIVADVDFVGKKQLNSVTINRIDIGYLLPLPDVNVIQPIYVLRGTGVLASGERITLTYYLPAVKNR